MGETEELTNFFNSARFLPVTLLVFIIAVAGCVKNENPIDAADVEQEDVVTLRAIDESELVSVIADCRGKVVLVDYWATWCLSCVELFPHTVELHEKFGEKDLVVISVSLDDSGSQEAVLDFLKKHRATFDNFVSIYGAGTESLKKFNLPGPLPQLQLFDREGKLRRSFPEPQSPFEKDAVDKAIRKLLAEG